MSFVLRYDYFKRYRGSSSYFLLAAVGYAVGVLITDLVLLTTHQGQVCTLASELEICSSSFARALAQPALLYLVPCTLGVVCFVAWRRGDLAEMWKGIEDEQAAQAAQHDNGAQSDLERGGDGGGERRAINAGGRDRTDSDNVADRQDAPLIARHN